MCTGGQETHFAAAIARPFRTRQGSDNLTSPTFSEGRFALATAGMRGVWRGLPDVRAVWRARTDRHLLMVDAAEARDRIWRRRNRLAKLMKYELRRRYASHYESTAT